MIKHPNQAAAEWRLRSRRREAIFFELKAMGSIAALGCSSILTTLSGFEVMPVQSYSHWKETLEESPMWSSIKPDRRPRLRAMDFKSYTLMENGFQSFSRNLVLAIQNLEDERVLIGLNTLKIKYVELCSNPSDLGNALSYLKYLGKLCQAIFLQAEELPKPPFEVIRDEMGHIVPFIGQLQFVDDIICGKRKRSEGLTSDEARSLAQLSSVSRSLPYPTIGQTVQSVKEVIELVTSKPDPIQDEVLESHRLALRKFSDKLRPLKLRGTHVSLSNSGSVENPRSTGGKAQYLVSLAKETTSVPLNERSFQTLSGKKDCYGVTVLQPNLWLILTQLIIELDLKSHNLTLGDVLYIPRKDLKIHLTELLQKEEPQVPRLLGYILNNVASCDLLKLGSYNRPFTRFKTIICFNPDNLEGVEFIPNDDYLKVKSELSLEAGMKTRLVTSAHASFTHVGQLVNSTMRDRLSHDPFMRVGFEEADKLWELLKAYRRVYNRTHN